MVRRIGCPNPYNVELTAEIVQAGERLSAEIASIQNSLRMPDGAEFDASSLPKKVRM